MPVEIKLGDVGFNHPGPRPVDEPRCPYCGYTEEDKRTLMDHHICDARNGPLPDPTVCKHGGLKRKCRVCELEGEVAILKETLEDEREDAKHWQAKEQERMRFVELCRTDAKKAIREALGKELWDRFWGPELEQLGATVYRVWVEREKQREENAALLAENAELKDRHKSWDEYVMRELTIIVRSLGGKGEGGHAIDRAMVIGSKVEKLKSENAELKAALEETVKGLEPLAELGKRLNPEHIHKEYAVAFAEAARLVSKHRKEVGT